MCKTAKLIAQQSGKGGLVVSKAQIADQYAGGVGIENGQAPQPECILVAQRPAAVGGTRREVAGLLYRHGATRVPDAIGVGKAGDRIAKNSLKCCFGIGQLLHQPDVVNFR